MSESNWMIVLDRRPGDPLIDALLAAGHCVMAAPDLYDLAADSVTASAINEYAGEVVVCAAYTHRAITAILAALGVTRKTTALSREGLDDAALAKTLADICGPADGDGELRDFTARQARRWYPVIDPQRCTNCRACVEFCLFGVYELDAAGKCFVAIADNCKTGCPSCARVCPSSAIIFPRYPGGGAIAGGEGVIERLGPDAARAMGRDDVQLYGQRYGQDDFADPAADTRIAQAVDDLESFDA